MVDIRKWLFGDRGEAMEEAARRVQQDALAPFAARITASELPIISIATSAESPREASGSRLGGTPWWPKDRPYPRDVKGAPLFLLAQINFAEAPRLDPFPQRGLLQIFIGAGDLYGCDLDNPLKSPGFACIYHEDFAGPRLTDFSFLTLGAKDYLPLEKPLEARAMTFTPGRMTIDPGDYRFETLLPEIASDESLSEAYFEQRSVPAIRMGGYPTFTQTDPRSYGDPSRYGDFTLLTVDTTDGIMWGDSGAAQFFMHDADLRRRDFSRVAYNWDCC